MMEDVARILAVQSAIQTDRMEVAAPSMGLCITGFPAWHLTHEDRYCGRSNRHCQVDSGCQSGCLIRLTASPAEQLTPTVPGNGTANGTVNLALDQEPTLGLPTGASNGSSKGSLTKNGSCGVNFGGAICGNWPRGACCSMYSYCGNRYDSSSAL